MKLLARVLPLVLAGCGCAASRSNLTTTVALRGSQAELPPPPPLPDFAEIDQTLADQSQLSKTSVASQGIKPQASPNVSATADAFVAKNEEMLAQFQAMAPPPLPPTAVAGEQAVPQHNSSPVEERGKVLASSVATQNHSVGEASAAKGASTNTSIEHAAAKAAAKGASLSSVSHPAPKVAGPARKHRVALVQTEVDAAVTAQVTSLAVVSPRAAPLAAANRNQSATLVQTTAAETGLSPPVGFSPFMLAQAPSYAPFAGVAQPYGLQQSFPGNPLYMANPMMSNLQLQYNMALAQYAAQQRQLSMMSQQFPISSSQQQQQLSASQQMPASNLQQPAGQRRVGALLQTGDTSTTMNEASAAIQTRERSLVSRERALAAQQSALAQEEAKVHSEEAEDQREEAAIAKRAAALASGEKRVGRLQSELYNEQKKIWRVLRLRGTLKNSPPAVAAGVAAAGVAAPPVAAVVAQAMSTPTGVAAPPRSHATAAVPRPAPSALSPRRKAAAFAQIGSGDSTASGRGGSARRSQVSSARAGQSDLRVVAAAKMRQSKDDDDEDTEPPANDDEDSRKTLSVRSDEDSGGGSNADRSGQYADNDDLEQALIQKARSTRVRVLSAGEAPSAVVEPGDAVELGE